MPNKPVATKSIFSVRIMQIPGKLTITVYGDNPTIENLVSVKKIINKIKKLHKHATVSDLHATDHNVTTDAANAPNPTPTTEDKV